MSTHKEALKIYIKNMQLHTRTVRLLIKSEKAIAQHHKSCAKLSLVIAKTCEDSIDLYEKDIALSQESIVETRERLKTEE